MTLTKSRTAKFVAGFVGIAMALSFVVTPVTTSAATVEELQAMIASLSAQLSALSGGTTTTVATGYTFNKNLTMGSKGADVLNLQKVLNMSADTRVNQTANGAGSPGNETSSFGGLTRAAVIKFQIKNGITPASGYVGALTRAKLNAAGPVVSTPGTTPTPGQTGAVTVTLSSDTPVSGTIIAGQASADLMHITFTGSGTVKSVTLTRGGISDQSTLTNVYLYDGDTRLTDGYSFNNAGTLTINNVNLTVSGSKTISVRADVASNTTSYSLSTTLTGVNVDGAANTVNVKGNDMFIAVGSNLLGTANLTVASPSPAATTLSAGSLNQSLWLNTLSIGSHASKLYGMTVKMVGSAPLNTLANVNLFVDGVKVATATNNSNGQFIFSLSSSPLTLTTGSHQIEVRGDIVGGAFRNFYLTLEKSADLAIRDGQVSGGGVIAISPTYLTALLNNVLGGTVTVSAGSLTVNQDVAFNNTTTLVGGATNVKMAAFKFTSYGEDVKVNSLTFAPTFTSLSSGTTLANVGLYVNGGQVGSNVTATTGTPLVFNSLGSNLIIPLGSSAIVEIRGDVVSATGTLNITSGTVKFDLSSVANNAQGVTSGNLTTTPPASGQSLTVSSSNVAFAQTAGFAGSTVAPNKTGVKVGSFTLSTASAEGITVNNILLGVGGTMVGAGQLTNLTIKDAGTVVGTPIGNPTGSNNFSVTLPVSISSIKTFDVYADIGSGAAGQTVIPTMTVTYRGAVSNVSTTTLPVTGATITSNVATISASGVTFVPSSSAVAQYLVGGQSAFAIGTFNVKSNGIAGATVKDVTVTVPANTIGSVTMNGVLGQVVGTTATLYNVGITVPGDNSGINVPMTVSLVCVNASGGCSGISSSTVNAQITSLTYNDGSAIQTLLGMGSATTTTHKLVASKPTLAMLTSSGAGFGNGSIKIGEFTVSADAGGDIKIQQLPIAIATSGASVITAGTVELRDSTGNTVIVGTGGVNGSAGLSASGNFVFNTSPRVIAKGTSETYTVYATFTGVTGGSNTMNETFSLGPKTAFLWTDVIGGAAGVGIDGSLLNTYPSATQSKNN